MMQPVSICQIISEGAAATVPKITDIRRLLNGYEGLVLFPCELLVRSSHKNESGLTSPFNKRWHCWVVERYIRTAKVGLHSW